MLKVPRLWAQRIVNLAKTFPAGGITAVIYIGSDVVTLGYSARYATCSGVQNSNPQIKKRLGSRSSASSLTQSLTLSHIHMILAQLNSSAPITIILPAARFTRLNISAPADLAPQDTGPTLAWALQQQGFSPVADWLWDATMTTQSHTHAATYDVLLIEAATVEGFLQRLGVHKKRLMTLVADTAVPGTESAEICGPWLNATQARQVWTLLNTQATNPAQPLPNQPSVCAPAALRGSREPFNLAYNLIARVNARYREAFYQSALIASAVLFVGVAWGWQSINTPVQNNTSTTLQSQPPPIPAHPMFTHAHVWQQLHALNGNNVEVKRLEFRHSGWLLQIQAQNPRLADAWISQFRDHLNLLPTNNASELSDSPWRVLTSASRSDKGSTQIDLELLQ